MALNVQTFKTRALTAVVFVLIMLLGLLWNHWSFFILFSVIHFGCWLEYQKLIGIIDHEYTRITPFHKYGVMLAGWSLMLYCSSDFYRIGSLSLHSIGWWLGLVFLFALPVMELLLSKELSLKNIRYSFLGLIYVSLSWALMIELGNPDITTSHVEPFTKPGKSSFLPLLIILCIWINDTMAYIIGSLIGKTPFSKISPKKTWEGILGGSILCVAVVTYFLQTVIPWKHLLIISSVCAVFGTLGDLLESKIKRMAHVKDSGHIMPGHGGFLDRFDSVILSTPFVWLYVKFLTDGW